MSRNRQAPFEYAREFEAGLRTDQEKQRLNRLGAAFILLAVALPLFIAFVLPHFAIR